MYRKKADSFLLMAMLMVVAMAISGCLDSGKADVSNESDVKELTIGEMWDIESIDPAEDMKVICEKALVVETLVTTNEDFSLAPGLATSWQQLDNNTWEFKLRKDVKFHDGTNMTAEDVKFSLDRAISRNVNVASMLNIKSIEVKDNYTLLIKTADLNTMLPAVLHYPCTAIINRNSVDENGDLIKLISTGPYMFESFDEQTNVLTVVKNKNWWGGKVGLDRMVIKGMPDPNTRAIAIESGDIDFTVDVPYSETDRIDALEGINVEKHVEPRVYKIDVNLAKDKLNDTRVRQAISYAIDRDSIVKNVLYNVGEPAAGPFLPNMVWTNKDLEPYKQDYKKADSLLTEAGWIDTDGDGIRDKDGQKLELTLMTFSTRPGLPPMAEAIAAQLSKIGIKVTPEVLEYGDILERQKEGNWDLSLAPFAIAMVPDPEFILTNWYSTNGTDNKPGYSNPEVDKLIEETKGITNQEERYAKFNEVEKIVYEEQPMILVAYYGCDIVKKDTVKGYIFDPTAHDYRINAGMYIEK
ncbi:peptide ABC transporter substrate-binding protein [Methanosarcina sp. A14]|uniref:Oligopeptide ABC transporter, periplasmic oligopeptide-binding protein OppA n=2 Tax=Methanosarcina barkeri TaxID=2208 RepID=A0A0E3QZ51_METBA|nr:MULTISPECIES: ABC transporter substrate-binding protein [Methanosarcina]AKB56204.1 Oligopeptide ABC transporter, periplasmic oligopeptide-binding protein OppA [Methanosarcina barkeri MS]OED01762.1 peptide ABC transporter substrate-binding protein [Methanosarcina sp. A14]